MLIEVHIIQNHAPSNLNRDESGSPKTAYFGGYRRARISSQCLKRCYRTSKTFRSELDGEPFGMHTCAMPDEVIHRTLRAGIQLTEGEQHKLKADLAKVVKKGERSSGNGPLDSDQDEEEGGDTVEKSAAQKDKLKTAQSVFYREDELDALAKGIGQWVQEGKKEKYDPKDALRDAGLKWKGIPVDMALFGRMVTSELMHNIEASCQFAHAISTHEFAREYDFWTRVDDRRDRRLDFYKAWETGGKIEPGTDGMGDAEFTSACFYSYFNVDFNGLIDNLTGKSLNHGLEVSNKDKERAEELARKAVIGLLKAAIYERPTGMFNSMATPSLPTLVLVELQNSSIPVSYADAFVRPVDPKNEETQNDSGQINRINLAEESARRLIREANRITNAFCLMTKKQFLFLGGRDLGEIPASVKNDSKPLVENVDALFEKLKCELRLIKGE